MIRDDIYVIKIVNGPVGGALHSAEIENDGFVLLSLRFEYNSMDREMTISMETPLEGVESDF